MRHYFYDSSFMPSNTIFSIDMFCFVFVSTCSLQLRKRSFIQLCVKLCKSATESLEMFHLAVSEQFLDHFKARRVQDYERSKLANISKTPVKLEGKKFVSSSMSFVSQQYVISVWNQLWILSEDFIPRISHHFVHCKYIVNDLNYCIMHLKSNKMDFQWSEIYSSISDKITFCWVQILFS